MKSMRLLTLASLFVLTACGDSDTPFDPGDGATLNCTGGTPIAFGATMNGTLQPGDLTDSDGAWLDRYSFANTTTRTVEITMRSSQLDSWLWLLTSTGGVITYDDDSGGGVNGFDARIVHSLARGCYLIEATTFPGETGAYTLTVK